MECDSKAYLRKTYLAAVSTIAIRGYKLSPTNRRTDSDDNKFAIHVATVGTETTESY